MPLLRTRRPDKASNAVLEAGAEWLGFTPQPQQRQLAAVVLSGRRSTAQLPRRSGKSLGMFATLLGMCRGTPGLLCAFTAQSGVKATDLFRDELLTRLQTTLPVDPDDPDPPYRIALAAGRQRLTLANGSAILVHPPKAHAFRSSAFDIAWVDEAQEVDLEDAKDLMAGLLPTLDTRGDRGRVITTGTAGKTRDCLLYQHLVRAHAGEIGGLIYGAREGDDPDNEATWWRAHPGLANGLTTIDILRDNRADPELAPAFDQEYLGLWPPAADERALDVTIWRALAAPFVPRPERVVLAFDVDPLGASAAIVAAFTDDDGATRVELVDHRDGSGWLPARVYTLARRYGATVAYDNIGANLDAAGQLERQRPRIKLHPLTFPEAMGACVGMWRKLHNGGLRHHGQPGLDVAVAGAVRRPVGDGGWMWGRRKAEADVTPLIAATWAVAELDRTPARRPLQVAT